MFTFSSTAKSLAAMLVFLSMMVSHVNAKCGATANCGGYRITVRGRDRCSGCSKTWTYRRSWGGGCDSGELSCRYCMSPLTRDPRYVDEAGPVPIRMKVLCGEWRQLPTPWEYKTKRNGKRLSPERYVNTETEEETYYLPQDDGSRDRCGKELAFSEVSGRKTCCLDCYARSFLGMPSVTRGPFGKVTSLSVRPDIAKKFENGMSCQECAKESNTDAQASATLVRKFNMYDHERSYPLIVKCEVVECPCPAAGHLKKADKDGATLEEWLGGKYEKIMGCKRCNGTGRFDQLEDFAKQVMRRDPGVLKRIVHDVASLKKSRGIFASSKKAVEIRDHIKALVKVMADSKDYQKWENEQLLECLQCNGSGKLPGHIFGKAWKRQCDFCNNDYAGWWASTYGERLFEAERRRLSPVLTLLAECAKGCSD